MPSEKQATPQAQLTDIRFVIASALGLIGIFLIACSFIFDGADEMAKTGGLNANLWAGLGLSAVALVMGLWWRLRPDSKPQGN